MEIPAVFYLSCWSLISITCLKLGFEALEREDFNISPLVIFSLKRFLAVCVCHSSTYALVHRHGTNNTSLFNHLKLSILGFSFLFYVSIFLQPIPLTLVLCYALVVVVVATTTVDTGLCVDFIVRSITFSLEARDDAFFPVFVLVTAFFTAGVAALICDGISSGSDPNRSEIEPVETGLGLRKIARFAALSLAGVTFHVFVRFEALSHVMAVLWFAAAWLGCIALTMPRSDWGLFYLLVCNVVVGCTTRFGLSGPTWLANIVSVVLLVLHDYVTIVRFAHDRDTVLW